MSKLILDGKVIWENPPGLVGFFGIKLRKQRNEIRAVEEMEKRMRSRSEINEGGTKLLIEKFFEERMK